MSPAKISVAMCTYNGAQYVGEQLESIERQTLPPDELVICDDGSTDSTVEIIREFGLRSTLTVRLFVNATNLGVVKNFEQAIASCGGEIIALADQDDVWLPEKLRSIEEKFRSAPEVGAVFSDAEIVDSRLSPTGHTMWEYAFTEPLRRRFSEGGDFDVLLAGGVVTGATMAFRSRLKEIVLPLPCGIKMIHDAWIALITAAVAELAYIERPLIKYRQHEGQQFGVVRPEKFDPLKFVMTASRTHGESYLALLKTFKSIHERMAAHRDKLRRPELLPLMAGFVAHLDSRGHLPEKRLRRIPPVCRELRSLRYHRYSNGFGSALKDIWF